jgi:hypothetical protein
LVFWPHLWMFSFISKKISDKKFCTWDIICDYFIHHHFRPIVKLYFLNYSDSFSIIFIVLQIFFFFKFLRQRWILVSPFLFLYQMSTWVVNFWRATCNHFKKWHSWLLINFRITTRSFRSTQVNIFRLLHFLMSDLICINKTVSDTVITNPPDSNG